MSQDFASPAAPPAEDGAYELLVQDALRDLSAAEHDDVLEPVGSGDEGPLMAWFVAS
jgi:hypothetical protein